VSPGAERIVLVGGHESDDGADLVRFERMLPTSAAVRPGRALRDVVSSAAGETVHVVPMTFGRDPAMVADTARSLRWLARTHGAPITLTAPFGRPDHLVARLRAAAGRDPAAALVVAAGASNPFDDAELHRIGHLVRVYGAGSEVAVATGSVADVLDRLRRLGFARTVVVPAGFGQRVDADGPGLSQHGPLLSDGAVARIVAERVDAARHDLRHGHDGIAAGLAADHDHGYAHSHSHSHTHGGHPPWRAESPSTSTVPTTSRSTPVAPRSPCG
jgi:sirohydrochlorin cobaltochelatase